MNPLRCLAVAVEMAVAPFPAAVPNHELIPQTAMKRINVLITDRADCRMLRAGGTVQGDPLAADVLL